MVFYLDFFNFEGGWNLSEVRMLILRGGFVVGMVKVKGYDGMLMFLVYIFGGEGNFEEGVEGMFDQVEVFEFRDGGSWREDGMMLVVKYGIVVVGIGGGVYIFGGGIWEGGLLVNDFEVYFL